MKKIMVVLMILVAFGASAESWLSVDWSFQLGWYPDQTDSIYAIGNGNQQKTQFFNLFQIETTIFNIFKIGGSCETNIMPSSVGFPYFSPLGTIYQFWTGIEPIKGISFIYQHQCTHTMQPYYASTIPDADHDRFYIEIKKSFDF